MSFIQPVSKAREIAGFEPIVFCGKQRRRYPSNFKLAAVRRVVECGETVTAVAEDLGIHRSTLGRWKREFGARIGAADPDHTEALAPLVQKLDAESGAAVTQAALRAALRGECEPGNWSTLLADGIALQRRRLGRMESSPSSNDELIGDAAVGQSLISDTQDAIDRMIHAGRMATARRLAAFRSELRQGLLEIVDRIGMESFREAQARAERLYPDENEQRPVLRTINDGNEGARKQRPPMQRRRMRHAARHVESTDRSRPLLFVLAGLVLLWIALSLPRLHQQPLPVLGFGDFRHVSGISEITARPPSLFIVFDADFWGELSVADRRQLVGKIGVIAHRAGYRGAQCTTTQGEPVARWLRQAGPQLVGEGDDAALQAYVVPPF